MNDAQKPPDAAKPSATTLRTMEEFSHFVGLSRPTVSKYFNNPSSVRPVTRTRIEAAIEASGFRPNLIASNLKRRRTRILGVIVPNATDPFYMELSRRIEEIAGNAGYFSFMLSSNGRPELEVEAIDKLQSMSIAGAIVVPLGGEQTSKRLARLESRIPLVYVDCPPGADAPYVGTDNMQSFGMLVEYLCRTGEPPCFLGMPEINGNAGARRRAYTAAMEKAGQKPHLLEIEDSLSWDFEAFGRAQLNRHLARGLPSRAVLCANDRLAFGALLAAWEAGLKVGQGSEASLSIAGHDDHPLSRYSCPPMTTVAQSYTQIASLAMTQLMDRLEAEQGEVGPAGEQILLPGTLILRNSA